MHTEILAAITSAKTILSIAKSAHGLANHTELLVAANEVNSKLSEAVTAALASEEKRGALMERLRELEDKYNKIRNNERKMKRYYLHELPTGQLVYEFKRRANERTPAHYACATCMDKSAISKLQLIHAKRRLHCFQCKSTFAVEFDPPIQRRISKGIRF